MCTIIGWPRAVPNTARWESLCADLDNLVQEGITETIVEAAVRSESKVLRILVVREDVALAEPTGRRAMRETLAR